jgi:hypothetical protein
MPFRKESKRLPKHKPVTEMQADELWTFLAIVLEQTEILLERLWAIVRILAIAALLYLASVVVSQLQLSHRNHALDRIDTTTKVQGKQIGEVRDFVNTIKEQQADPQTQAENAAIGRTLRQVDVLCRANPVCAAEFPPPMPTTTVPPNPQG